MSIIEIANRTGISKSTVSRVLNNGSVSKKKRLLVEQAIMEMGYRVPKLRRGPKKKRGKIVIGLLFLVDDFRLLQSPDSSYSLIFHSLIGSDIKEDVEISPRFLVASSLNSKDLSEYDGFIILGSIPRDEIVLDCIKKILNCSPAVYIQDSITATAHSTPLENIDRVYYENQLVGCLAAKYFLSKKYKRIALLNPYYRHPIHEVRVSSFNYALYTHGLEASLYIRQTPQSQSSPSFAEIDELVEQMIQDGLPEGLFVTADIRTVHTYNLLLSRGVKPMKDIDIISCDNIPFFTEQMNPKPAEIDIGLSKIGSCAIELLQRRIAGDLTDPQTILVRPELVI
jgi:DNA-binding LacI/PurR family transcriptional regulator